MVDYKMFCFVFSNFSLSISPAAYRSFKISRAVFLSVGFRLLLKLNPLVIAQINPTKSHSPTHSIYSVHDSIPFVKLNSFFVAIFSVKVQDEVPGNVTQFFNSFALF